jgi:hypothetical protein
MAIGKSLPDLLRFGYVFLADAESQGGLIGAGEKINSIQTQLSGITPYTLLVQVAGKTEVQVSYNGQTSLLPLPYIPPAWQPREQESNEMDSVERSSDSQGTSFSLWDDFIAPPPEQVTDVGKAPNYRIPQMGNTFFKLRESAPQRFKAERLPLSTEELVQCISKRIDLSAEVLNAGLRKNQKITRKTVSNIFEKADEIVDSIQAKLSNAEIARRAQKVLFDAEFIDMRDIHELLLARLRSEYNDHQGMDLSELELAHALNMILATYPYLVRDASRACAARFKELYNAELLPAQVEAPDSITRSRLNVYSIMPQDLNETERSFAEMLDADTTGTVGWWQRNEPRKPWSVGIVMPSGDRYFPDFIIGVNGRSHGEGVLLVEIKGGHILNGEDTLEKINAEHKFYGKPAMLTKQDDGRFWIMRYIESARRIEQDQVFRVENMGQY